MPLVLALHELATNAVKYGALSIDTGSVQLSWATVGEGAGKTGLHMRWQESGGPSVAQPSKRGLGAKLLRPQFGLDEVKVAFEPTGVECEIHLVGVRPIEAGDKNVSQHALTIFYASESLAAPT